MPTLATSGRALRAAITAEGFAFVHGSSMRELLAPYGSLSDWTGFAESWERLELDTYMADGGRYRRRRHAVYRVVGTEPPTRQPHQPHFQTLDYNPLHGGIERWFAPVEPEIGSSACLTTVLAFCQGLFGTFQTNAVRKSDVDETARTGAASSTAAESAQTVWRVEVHQFRIEARPGEVGRPTPEGLHRDGVDHVLVLLVSRRNIARGVTAIHSFDGRPLGHFTLTDPLDAAIVDDARVAHGVTPVEPIDPALPAYRDVLVVTFARRTGE
jgi:hypothetical protein